MNSNPSSLFLQNYSPPGYYHTEDEKHTNDDEEVSSHSMSDYLGALVRQMDLEKNEKKYVFNSELYLKGDNFLLGVCKLFDGTIRNHKNGNACVVNKLKSVGEIENETLSKLEQQTIKLIQNNPENSEKIKEEYGEKLHAQVYDFIVNQKKGGMEGKGMKKDEFDRYDKLGKIVSIYFSQPGPTIVPFEQVIPNKDDRDFLAKCMDVACHVDLIEPFLEIAFDKIQFLNDRFNNIVVTAAFAHNVITYVHPKLDGNGRSARLACNSMLAIHGFWPILAPEEGKYYDAVSADMAASPRVDDVKECKISVLHLASFIIEFQLSNPCYECGKTGCTLKCSSCHYMYYCSKECQKKNWKHHKSFCQTNHNILGHFIEIRNAHIEQAKIFLTNYNDFRKLCIPIITFDLFRKSVEDFFPF